MNTLTIPERIDKATSEVPLLNLEQKEALALIDTNPKSRSQAAGTMDLVGVIAGLKPVAFLHTQEINPALVSAVGLNWELIEYGMFAASRDEHLSLELKEVFLSHRNNEGNLTDDGHRIIGKLLGYPESATDYFVDRLPTVFTPVELPMVKSRALEGTSTDFFHQFVLSPGNHQSEIDDYIKPLETAVRELTPNTYKYIETENRRDQVAKKIGRFLRPLIGLKPKEVNPGIKTVYVD
jgi:hypothetical protein